MPSYIRACDLSKSIATHGEKMQWYIILESWRSKPSGWQPKGFLDAFSCHNSLSTTCMLQLRMVVMNQFCSSGIASHLWCPNHQQGEKTYSLTRSNHRNIYITKCDVVFRGFKQGHASTVFWQYPRSANSPLSTVETAVSKSLLTLLVSWQFVILQGGWKEESTATTCV